MHEWRCESEVISKKEQVRRALDIISRLGRLMWEGVPVEPDVLQLMVSDSEYHSLMKSS